MRSKREILRILQDHLPYMASTYGVKRIGLFGSYASGTPTEESDIDVVVEFDRPIGFRFVEFADYLERLLGKRVDVLTPTGIQAIRIEYIAEQIEESTVYVS